MARPSHDAVVTLGEYTAADGTKKKRYQNVGKLFTQDDGRQSLKLDVIPCGPGWSGWISFYPIQRDAPPPDSDPRPEPRNRNIPANRENPPPDNHEDDDIPF